MRTLTVVITLLWCVTQAMAVDHCASLKGHSLNIDANGFKGVIGPSGITPVNQNGTFHFQTTASNSRTALKRLNLNKLHFDLSQR